MNSKRDETGAKTRACLPALADGLEDLISPMPIPVAVFDTAMRLIATSAAFQESYGVDISSAREPGDGDLLPWLPEGYPAAREKALTGEVVQCDESKTTLPDGREIRNRWITAPRRTCRSRPPCARNGSSTRWMPPESPCRGGFRP